MSNTQSTILEILKEAISIEIFGKEYYSIFSGLVEDENVKAMFRKLSSDEEEHREIVEKEYKKLSGKSLDMKVLDEENRVKARQVFPESLVPMDISEAKDVLKLGIRTEERSIELYSKSARLAEKESSRLFLKLVNFEEGHREKLLAALEHLEEEGTWSGTP